MTIEVGGVAGALPRLAPDLLYPSEKAGSTITYKRTSDTNCMGALTTLLSLPGKHMIGQLIIENLTAETVTFKVTTDDGVIWNDTFTCGTSESLISPFSTTPLPEIYEATNFLLEVQTLTDTSIRAQYLSRPVT